MNNAELLSELSNQERDIQFTQFNSHLAFQIGSYVVKKGLRESLPIAVDITVGSRCLFHFSFDGASMDNERWIERKRNSVLRFNHSSYYMGRLLEKEGKSMNERFMIKEEEYAFHGGCFPIIIKNTGVIGTMTISGLTQQEDHALVVEALKEYLL